MRFLGKAFAITVKEIVFFVFGFKAVKAFKYLFAIQPRGESVRPNKYISFILHVCDMAVNLTLWPFGLRKKRDWKLVYQIWCTERGREHVEQPTREQDRSGWRDHKRRDNSGIQGVHGYENAA